MLAVYRMAPPPRSRTTISCSCQICLLPCGPAYSVKKCWRVEMLYRSKTRSCANALSKVSLHLEVSVLVSVAPTPYASSFWHPRMESQVCLGTLFFTSPAFCVSSNDGEAWVWLFYWVGRRSEITQAPTRWSFYGVPFWAEWFAKLNIIS